MPISEQAFSLLGEQQKPDIRRTAFGILPQQRPAGLAESGRNNEVHHVPLLPAHVRNVAAILWHRHIYCIETTRTQIVENNTVIYQGR